LTGGRRLGSEGYYIEPTIFSNVKVINYISIKVSNLVYLHHRLINNHHVFFPFYCIKTLKEDMLIAKDEIFGPVMSLMKFK
jgi:acyl-CoA reductase-like NAD-dependent aldehyde dehydrogenase